MCAPKKERRTLKERTQLSWYHRCGRTILLVTPEFCQFSGGGFDMFAETLNQALACLGVEDDLQLVFFHPE